MFKSFLTGLVAFIAAAYAVGMAVFGLAWILGGVIWSTGGWPWIFLAGWPIAGAGVFVFLCIAIGEDMRSRS